MNEQHELFSYSDINDNKIDFTTSINIKSDKTLTRYEKADNVISKLIESETTCYVSVNDFSMIELLETALNKCGDSNVYITTWSINENAARKFVELKQSGKIKKLLLITDWRIRVRKQEPIEILRNNDIEIIYTNCHAKVTVIENNNLNITIVSSANFTNNPRIESGVIFTNKEISQFYIENIRKAAKDAKTK